MICDTEEFLLVLQKWMTESATVVALVLIFGDDPDLPAMGSRLTGRIFSVDVGMPGFCFAVNDESAILVNLQGWEISFGADIKTEAEPAKELFALRKSGAAISVLIPAETE